MGILSSIKNFFCDLFGIETKEEKEVRLKEEQNLPQTGEEQKETSDKEKEEKEHQWKNVNEQVKFVCQGGKVQCQYCNPPLADLVATSTTVLLQDKPFITKGDKDGKVNFNFTGLCMHPSQQKPFSPPPPCKAVISLGEWKDYSHTMIDDHNALLVKSTIPCMVSGMDLKIIDSGQKAELTQVKPKVKREFRVTKLYWMDENEENNIEMAERDEKAILFVETEDFKPDQRVTIPLKDTKTGEEYKLKGRLDSFGKARIPWRGGPCPSEDDYYYEEDRADDSAEEEKEVSEDKPGYYYQEDGTFLGKIGNSENVYITDRVTYSKIEKKEKVEDSKVIAFTEKYKLNNLQLLDRANWIFAEGRGGVALYYAFALENSYWNPNIANQKESKLYYWLMQDASGRLDKDLYLSGTSQSENKENPKEFWNLRKTPEKFDLPKRQCVSAVVKSKIYNNKDITGGCTGWLGYGDEKHYGEFKVKIFYKNSVNYRWHFFRVVNKKYSKYAPEKTLDEYNNEVEKNGL